MDNCLCGYLSVVVVVPGLVGVVSQIKAMPLFVAVDVQGGEGAPDLLEGDEGGGVGEHEVLHQLLAGHPADLKTVLYIFIFLPDFRVTILLLHVMMVII